MLDARGLACPKPVVLADDELQKISEGIVEIWVDNEASVSNLNRFASKGGFVSETFAEAGYWRVKIAKGYPCELPTAKTPVSAQKKKDLLLIVGTDTVGKDEALGRVLMKGIFETMKVTKELPHTIFFLNTGVRLTTVDSELTALMREFADMGVEIFTCGTCLKHFNLEQELKVGYRGTTNHIVEGMKDFDKTVWVG
ncbi:MAG TPA: sulfurtransferase-like selenium metabolism protein YedF [Dissulfurispiraceae bacterium]|nr:sulfurtransferase-like selenium metabolism protein YedF [Dissulfurispiraceae bacterium]